MDQEQEVTETPPEAAAAEAEAPEAETEATPEPDASETPAAEPTEGEVRPREVIRGIHPELLCECPECAPEYTELQWFSPEEERKTKGNVMLYCQRSSRKYFSPATEFQAWLADKPKRRRKD